MLLLFLSCTRKWETLNYITYSSGPVFITNAEGLEISGQVGKFSFPSRVSTGNESFTIVNISFPNFGFCKFSIYPNSYVEFKEAYKYPRGEIYVEISDIFGIVLLKSNECVLKYGGLTSKNSFLRLMKDIALHSYVEIIEGSAKLGRKEIFAGAGILKGDQKTEQYSLNQAVELVLPLPGRFPKPLVFMWKRTDRSSKYFLEISDDKNFETLTLIHETTSNTFFPEQITLKLTSDVYFWRIWYKDRDGKGSFFSSPISFTIRTQRVVK
ncbi:MAG: hypothetical protein NZ927_08310 [Candidatus Calescibacterium sp.]|nr:hypothetical protein [Candidatus Calescibacterium sp.]